MNSHFKSLFDFSESNPVIHWLLDSDPSLRWQVMQDLMDMPQAAVEKERSRIANEGLGAQLLALQANDGRWGEATWNHGWNSTMHALSLLRDLGLNPESEAAKIALNRVCSVSWMGYGPEECQHHLFFEGEIEPCINGQVCASGAYFKQDVRGIAQKLLQEQQPDGGWNCEAKSGSTRSSFNTTICVLEALLELELSFGTVPEITQARARGHEYLLDRQLYLRLMGTAIERDRKDGNKERPQLPAFTRIVFPTWWHYDFLRGLEYFRRAKALPDLRMQKGIDLLLSKQDHGMWKQELSYPGKKLIQIDADEGLPSKWNTLRALRVLKWYFDK